MTSWVSRLSSEALWAAHATMRRMTSPASAAKSLWSGAGLPPAALGRLQLPGTEPAVPSSFAIRAAMQVKPQTKKRKAKRKPKK